MIDPIPFPTPAPVEPFRKEGMAYVWQVAKHSVTLRADYLTHRGDEIQAEVTVESGGKHVYMAKHNLSLMSSRQSLVRVLEARTPTSSTIPWDALVENFCVGVLRREREGEPLQKVGRMPVAHTRYLIEHLVQEGKPNLLFAPGGSGKGYLSVATCIATKLRRGIAGLTVMPAEPIYFDWEDDAETMNDRTQRVCAGMGVEPVEINYQRMRGLLADRVNEMARRIAETGATYGVVDSVSVAAGTPGERGSYDQIAHRLFDALDAVPSGKRGVPMTWLLIDHVTGDSATQKGVVAGKAFGSIQKMNRARCAWEMRSDQEDGSSIVRATLFHAKFNHTGRHKPIGLELHFEGDKVTFERSTPVDPLLEGKHADRLAAAMGEGNHSVRALSIATRLPENTIRAVLSRDTARFRKDEDGLWWLVDSDDSDAPGEVLPWR